MSLTKDDTLSTLGLYQKMRNDFEPHGLITYALQKKHFATQPQAYEALEGLLQWIMCHREIRYAETPFVMLRGEVALMYDTMVESGLYERFCIQEFGIVIKRHEAHVPELSFLKNEKALEHTFTRLQVAYSNLLADGLKKWLLEPRPQILFYTDIARAAVPYSHTST